MCDCNLYFLPLFYIHETLLHLLNCSLCTEISAFKKSEIQMVFRMAATLPCQSS